MFASTPAVTDTQIQNLVLLFELNLVHKFGVGFPCHPRDDCHPMDPAHTCRLDTSSYIRLDTSFRNPVASWANGAGLTGTQPRGFKSFHLLEIGIPEWHTSSR